MLILLAIIVSAIILAVVFIAWRYRPRRSFEQGFPYVYVNRDGSARECSPGEQAYLCEEFSGGDGGRPYIKGRYESRNGWGSVAGFIVRRRVPPHIVIEAVHPDYDARVKARGNFDPIAPSRAAGDIIQELPSGAIRCQPNPAVSAKERWNRVCRWQEQQEAELEQLAKVSPRSKAS